MSGEEVDDEEGNGLLPPRIISDHEACTQLNQEQLLSRVRYSVLRGILRGTK